MSQSKESKVQAMVDAGGKSDDRMKGALRVFESFQEYAQYRGVDAAGGTDVQLPKVIAAWLGIIAGVGCEDGDVGQLITVRRCALLSN